MDWDNIVRNSKRRKEKEEEEIEGEGEYRGERGEKRVNRRKCIATTSVQLPQEKVIKCQGPAPVGFLCHRTDV